MAKPRKDLDPDILDRLGDLFPERGDERKQLAAELAVSLGAVGHYIAGRRGLDVQALLAIKKVTGISLDVLLTGRQAGRTYSPAIQRFMGLLEAMPRERLEAALAFLEVLAANHAFLATGERTGSSGHTAQPADIEGTGTRGREGRGQRRRSG